MISETPMVYLVMPTTGINNYNFETFIFEHVDAVCRDHHRVRLCVAAVKWNSGFGRVLPDVRNSYFTKFVRKQAKVN